MITGFLKNLFYISRNYTVMTKKLFKFLPFLALAGIILSGCDTKSVTTSKEYLNKASLDWLPVSGNGTLVFENDSITVEFHGTGEEAWFERVLYKTDQEGTFKVQQNYYADMERRSMEFISDSTSYVFTILMKRCKGDIGAWDELYVTLSDGFYYENTVKIITYKTANWQYGESELAPKVVLNEKTYNNVYFRQQERRPQNLYVNSAQGIVGYNTTSDDIWTIVSKK